MKKKPNNPRNISKKEFARLAADLETFGDLGGIVHNETTGNLVGGNQRAAVTRIIENGAEITIVEEYDPPTRTGTTARGYVLWNGEKYDYRRVAWDVVTEDAACLVANLRGGTWDWDVLTGWDAGLLAGAGFDAELLHSWDDAAANLREMLTAEADEPQDSDEERQTLSDRFGVPPFSVLDARQGYWQKRKDAWIAIGIQSELGRGGAMPSGSLRDATTLTADGHTTRGDSVGRTLGAVAPNECGKNGILTSPGKYATDRGVR